jgi:putative transposase
LDGVILCRGFEKARLAFLNRIEDVIAHGSIPDVPPHLSISKLMQSLKGKTSSELLSEHKELSKHLRGRHIWGRGYFAASWGNVTDEIIMEYIATQDVRDADGDFHIVP